MTTQFRNLVVMLVALPLIVPVLPGSAAWGLDLLNQKDMGLSLGQSELTGTRDSNCTWLELACDPYYHAYIPSDTWGGPFAQRFPVEQPCTLKTLRLMPYNGHPDFSDMSGLGIDVIIWEDDGSGFPGIEVGRINVPSAEMVYYPENLYVDVDSLGLVFEDDFHIGFTTVDQENDCYGIMLDDGSCGYGGASHYYMGMWETMLDDFGADASFLIATEVCMIPVAYLHVTSAWVPGPTCRWKFDFSETIYAPWQNADSVVMVIFTPGVTVDLSDPPTGCSGTPHVWTKSTYPAITFYTPSLGSNPCTGYASFDNLSGGSGAQVSFNAYSSLSSPWPCAFNDKNNPKGIGQSGECACFWPPKINTLWFPFDNDPYPDASNLRYWKRGRYVNGATNVPNGMVKGAACFDGVDDRIDVDFYGGIVLTTRDFSADAWVQLPVGSDQSGIRTIIDCREERGADIRGFCLFLYGNQLFVQLADGIHNNWASGLTVPVDGNWYFVAFTKDYDWAAGNQVLAFYLGDPISGVFQSSTPIVTSSCMGSLTHSNPWPSGVSLTIGDRITSPAGGACFNGCMDEIEMFYRALTPSQLEGIFRAGSWGKCKTKPWVTPIVLTHEQAMSESISAGVFNFKPTPRTYDWTIYGVDYGEGPVPADFSPSSGTVTVESGDYAHIPIEVVRPDSLVDPGQRSWFEIEVYDTEDGETYYVQSAMSITPSGLTADFSSDFLAAPMDDVGCAIWELGNLLIVNPGDDTVSSNYRILVVDDYMYPDMESVSLNGGDPGTPVEGSFELAPGEEISIPLAGSSDASGHMSTHNVMLQFDDGRGWIPAECMTVMCVSNQSPDCKPGDADGNGVWDIDDVVYLINYVFTGGPDPTPYATCSGDATCNCQVDIDDVVRLINYIFTGGPEPCSEEDWVAACGPLYAAGSDDIGLDAYQRGTASLGKLVEGNAELNITDSKNGWRQAVSFSIDADVEVQAVQLEFDIMGDVSGIEASCPVDGIRVVSGNVRDQFKVGLLDMEGRVMIPTGPDEILRISFEGDGDLELVKTIAIAEGGGTLATSVNRRSVDGTIPHVFSLHQNVPNPFNPTTDIAFSLAKPSHVTLDVYNIMGRKVATLVDEELPAGKHTVTWNGRTSDGQQAASGVYLYRITAGAFTDGRKMLLLK